MRPVRIIAIIAALLFATTVGMLAPAATASAAPTTLRVSPSSVTAGDTVVVSGSVGRAPAGSACASSLMLLSRAFVHTDEFAGVPALIAAVKPGGTFTTTASPDPGRPGSPPSAAAAAAGTWACRRR